MTDDLHSPEELRAHMGNTALRAMDAIDEQLGNDLSEFSEALVTLDQKLRQRNLPPHQRSMWIVGMVLGITLTDPA